MNSYSHLYWFYAMTNAQWGQRATIERDSLHSRYEVNQWGIDVTVPGLTASQMRKILAAKLVAAGYVEDHSMSSRNSFMKQVGNERRYASLSGEKNTLHIWAKVYR